MSELHRYIDDRAAFFRVLDETIAMDRGFGPELERMKQWTANGRQPTLEERRSVQMTGGLAYNYESMDADTQRFADRISELNYYFEWWPSDEEWNDPEAHQRWLLRR
jgi:hypothetical protein